MTREENRQMCAAALEEVRPLLPRRAYREAHDWIHAHGEWGLAVEHLIDWIYDDALPLNASQFRALEAALRAMGQENSPSMACLMKLRPPADGDPAAASTNPA